MKYELLNIQSQLTRIRVRLEDSVKDIEELMKKVNQQLLDIHKTERKKESINESKNKRKR